MAETDVRVDTDVTVSYKLLEKIGEGAMTSVYKAKSEQGETVAVRLCKDAKFAPYLVEEAKILSGVSHPNIISVLGFNEHGPDGLPVTVMKYAERGTLGNYIKEHGKLCGEELMSFTKQLLDALAYLHKNGIVHKDVKPDNILLDLHGNIFVTDLNLARPGESEGEDVLRSSIPNASSGKLSLLGGTDGWSAPEQMAGNDSSLIDHRTDLYSAANVIYSMATGVMPPAHEPPSEFGGPAWLDGFMKTARAHNQSERYSSADTMLSYFEYASKNTGDPYEGFKNFLSIFLIVGAVAGVLFGVGYFIWWLNQDADISKLKTELSEESGYIAYTAGPGKSSNSIFIAKVASLTGKNVVPMCVPIPDGYVKSVLWSLDNKYVFILKSTSASLDTFSVIYHLDPIHDQEAKLLINFNDNELDGDDCVKDMKISEDGRIYVQSMANGWYVLNMETKKMESVRLSDGDKLAIVPPFVNESGCPCGKHQLTNNGWGTPVIRGDSGDLDLSDISYGIGAFSRAEKK